jgi:hypothetical protein
VGESDGIINVLPSRVKLSRRRCLSKSFSLSKIFVLAGICDVVGGVRTYLPFVGKNIPPISIFRGGGMPILLATPSYQVLMPGRGWYPSCLL